MTFFYIRTLIGAFLFGAIVTLCIKYRKLLWKWMLNCLKSQGMQEILAAIVTIVLFGILFFLMWCMFDFVCWTYHFIINLSPAHSHL